MNRRRFIQIGSGAVAGAVIGREQSFGGGGSEAPSPQEITGEEFHRNRRFIEIEFGTIAYIERGEGPPALFLHGFPLNSFQWRGVIPRLAAHRRCIALDFLALGYTEVAGGQSVAPDSQVAMVARFLDKLSIRTVDIVANDSGGAIAQLFVGRYPQRVRTLLLTNCDTEPDSPPAAVLPVIDLARKGQFADEWLVRWLADKALARSEKGLGGQCYADPKHPTDEAIEIYLRPLVSSQVRKTQTNAYASALDPNPLAGIESALRRCTAPVRIVWGTADIIFSQSSTDYLDRIFGKSRGVRRVPEAKLFFPEELPALIAEEAIRLWQS